MKFTMWSILEASAEDLWVLSPAMDSSRRGSILLRMLRFTRVARTLRLLRVLQLFHPMRNLLDT